VFSLAHMLDLFANKLTCLCGRRLALLRIATRTLNYFFFWHGDSFHGPERAEHVMGIAESIEAGSD
jgi:hypothetical protein